MKKSKKKSREEVIKYYLAKAKHYNNAGQYMKAVANINLAYSIWDGSSNQDSAKAKKVLDKIITASDIIVNNYTAQKEREIYAMINC